MSYDTINGYHEIRFKIREIKMAKKKKVKANGVTFALANQKGGVGKSVSSVNLACSFGILGLKTLLVDFDYQGNASSQIGIKNQSEELEKTITEGLFYDRSVNEICLKTKFKNVYAIAATQEFSEFNIKFLGQPGSHDMLNAWLKPARNDFDIIIIDTHPSLDLAFQNAMVAADYYALPLFSEAESLEGLHIMFKHVKKIKERLNQTLHILGCFITKFDKNIPTHDRFMKTIKSIGKSYNLPLIGVIPYSKSFALASETKTPVVTKNHKIPVSEAYLTLAKNLKKDLIPNRRGRTPNTPEFEKEDVKNIVNTLRNQNVTPLVVEEAPSI